jgi:hypothetical protein
MPGRMAHSRRRRIRVSSSLKLSPTVLGVCSYQCVLVLILVGGMWVGWGGVAFGGLFDRLPLPRPAIPLRLARCAYGGAAFYSVLLRLLLAPSSARLVLALCGL